MAAFPIRTQSGSPDYRDVERVGQTANLGREFEKGEGIVILKRRHCERKICSVLHLAEQLARGRDAAAQGGEEFHGLSVAWTTDIEGERKKEE